MPFAGSPIEPDDVIDTDILVPASRLSSSYEEIQFSIDNEKKNVKEVDDSSDTATNDAISPDWLYYLCSLWAN